MSRKATKTFRDSKWAQPQAYLESLAGEETVQRIREVKELQKPIRAKRRAKLEALRALVDIGQHGNVKQFLVLDDAIYLESDTLRHEITVNKDLSIVVDTSLSDLMWRTVLFLNGSDGRISRIFLNATKCPHYTALKQLLSSLKIDFVDSLTTDGENISCLRVLFFRRDAKLERVGRCLEKIIVAIAPAASHLYTLERR